MPVSISLQLSPKQAADPKIYIPVAARLAGVSDKQVALARVVKRSVDARRARGGAGSHSAVKVNLTLELYIDGEQQPAPVHFDYPDVAGRTPVVVVGSGPAGLFCALRLIASGLRPIVLERGKDVVERGKDIALLNRGQGVNPESNYAFGEGGAGTFSDGKLYTRSKKRGDYNRALQTLVFHGASPEILYEAHPHIGTDKLPRIMTAIRQTIRRCGGEVVFGARVTDIEIRGGRAVGVWIHDAGRTIVAEKMKQSDPSCPACGSGRIESGPDGLTAQAVRPVRNSSAATPAQPFPSDDAARGGTLVEGAAVVLAAGHSARDIYEILHRRGVALEAKPFAMGVRIEHPQQLIDGIQYHTPEGRGEYLPAAAYQLVTQQGGRGVYSFCMCPGGFIVPAMTCAGEAVVNGMSPSLRNSPYANSGIVTEVRPADFEFLRGGFGELAGLEFQRRLERLAGARAGGARATGVGSATLPRGGVAGAATKTAAEAIVATDMAAAAAVAGLATGAVTGSAMGAMTESATGAAGAVTGSAKGAAGAAAAMAVANRAVAPAQRVADFVSARPSRTLPRTSYIPGIVPSRLDEWLPGFISGALRSGISAFGRQMRGFVTNEAVVVGVESRTSTPVRIPRDPATLAHPAVRGLYPAGEGAGYAGGIISAALDGERIAEAIAAAVK